MVFNNTGLGRCTWSVNCQTGTVSVPRSTCMAVRTQLVRQQSAKHRLSLNIEPISDRNFRSLYRKIFWQLNSTSISYIAPLSLLNDFDNDTYLVRDTQPRKEVLLLTSYSCALLWMIQKVDPELQLTSKAKSLFKSRIDRIYSCIYEVGCRIMTHIMIFSVRYIDDHVGRTGTETASVRTVHDSFAFH